VNFILADGTSVSVALDGTGVSSAVNPDKSVPSEFTLTLTPNPASGAVVAHLTIASESDSKLYVFDEAGHQVLTMQLGILSEGEHDIALPISELPSGNYFVQVRSANGDVVVARLVR
jgi:hypothetical protein